MSEILHLNLHGVLSPATCVATMLDTREVQEFLEDQVDVVRVENLGTWT
jgi:hypothetical protein